MGDHSHNRVGEPGGARVQHQRSADHARIRRETPLPEPLRQQNLLRIRLVLREAAAENGRLPEALEEIRGSDEGGDILRPSLPAYPVASRHEPHHIGVRTRAATDLLVFGKGE